MGHVLEPLLHDLAERFRFLEEELGRMTVPPEAEASRKRIHQIAARAKKRVNACSVIRMFQGPISRRIFTTPTSAFPS
jgi:hypothetical protein